MELSATNVWSSVDIKYIFLLSCVPATITLCIKIWRVCNIRLDSNEPPIVRHIVPYVGHLWGLMRHSHDYVSTLCQNTSHPIFTIPVAFGKVYVVGSPSLAQAVFRSKKLSFAPFVVEFVERLDLSQPAKQAYATGLHTHVMQAFATNMSGIPRKKMSAIGLQEVVRLLPGRPSHVAHEKDKNSEKKTPVNNLWNWLRGIMTIATTSSLLGKTNNPWIKDPSLVEAYWEFEGGDPSGRTSIIDVTHGGSKRESHTAMVTALDAYFAAGHDKDLHNATGDMANGSDIAPLTIDTAAIQRKYRFSSKEIGTTYVTIIHGALVNTVPTLFWCVVNIFSRPSLVSKLREELLATVVIGEDEATEGRRNVHVDIDSIEACCPLLLSVFRETQRLVAIGTLHRRVLEDTMVSDDYSDDDKTKQKQSYLLKKGTSILIPMANKHRNALIWGATANEFDADRFVRSRSHNSKWNTPIIGTVGNNDSGEVLDEENATTRLRKTAYFPFGGGKELCPGRHLATTEVLSTIVVLVLGYDIKAANGSTLKEPSFGPSKMTRATARPHPDGDLSVVVERREGWEEVVWGVR